jgi:hypothetical protein
LTTTITYSQSLIFTYVPLIRLETSFKNSWQACFVEWTE